MTATLLVAIAGGIGALGRVEWTAYAARRWPGAPWGTRGANVLGTAGLVALLLADPAPATTRVVAVGLLGGFTTFSTWMLDAQGQRSPGRLRELGGQLVPMALLAFVAVGMR